MNTLLSWLGGKKIGLSVLAFVVMTALYVLGLCFEWNGKALTADHWCSMTWKLILFAIGANVGGMAIHAFAKNKVSTDEKNKDE